MIRVVLADDHRPTLADLRETLEADGRFEVCAEAVDAPGAIEAAVREQPDVCVLDVCMPGGGVAAAWEIAARLPRTRIVMLTVSDDDRDLFPALRAGACGYLIKDIDPARLPGALADACAGGAPMPRTLVTRVLESLRTREPRRRPVVCDRELRLTSREWEVLDLLRGGLNTRQVARRLHLSDATVRSHVAAATRKLGVETREQALRAFAMRGRGGISAPGSPPEAAAPRGVA